MPSLSFMMIKPALAQSILTPSVPEFSVKYVDNSYDAPPTYGTDQYTGKSIIVNEGYHVDGRTIEFTIKNQPFASYNDSSGNYTTLYYNFRFKGHYGNVWTYFPFEGAITTHSYGGMYGGPVFNYYSASNSEDTIFSITLKDLTSFSGSDTPPNGSQMDFQVQAQKGFIYKIPQSAGMGPAYGFTGESSAWSNTQTITIQASSSSASPTSTLTPTPASTTDIPEFPAIAGLAIFLALSLFAITVLTIRKK